VLLSLVNTSFFKLEEYHINSVITFISHDYPPGKTYCKILIKNRIVIQFRLEKISYGYSVSLRTGQFDRFNKCQNGGLKFNKFQIV
jgi:hypothetical protein